jgi:hypothetical protein
MAFTKVIVVHTNLSRLVGYAADSEKTGLDAVIPYAVNPAKTGKKLYEYALNCNLNTAFQEMQATKIKFGKTGGRLAYHIIQSFKPGEITPEQAHKIGIEFAGRVFGNRYEAVIGTHLDREHLHNHLVVNSVSFVDGKKYRDNFSDFYSGIRGVSDDLCRENNLSVIEKLDGKGLHYSEWQAEKESKPTIRSQIRDEIEEVISRSYTFKSFVEGLKALGYKVKYGESVKYMTVTPPYGTRSIRLKSLGADYTEEAIKKRLLRQQSHGGNKLPGGAARKRRYKKPFKIHKLHGFKALYFRYLYMLGKVRKKAAPPKMTAYFRDEVIKFERHKERYGFINAHNIVTTADLSDYENGISDKIVKFIEKRKNIYKEMRGVENGTPKESALLEAKAQTAAELRILRKDLSLCGQIRESAEAMRGRVKTAAQIAGKESKAKEEVNRNERRFGSR